MREHFERAPERTPPTTAQKFLKYFGLFMTLIYPAFGIYLLVSSPQQLAIQPQVKQILGIMLIVYGLFRFYRAYMRYFKEGPRVGRND
jgi:hypothetical protein